MSTDASAEQILPADNSEGRPEDVKQCAEKHLSYTSAQVQKLDSQVQTTAETEKMFVSTTAEAGNKKIEQQTNADSPEWNDLRSRINERISATNNDIASVQREIQNLGRFGRFIGRMNGALRGMQLTLEAHQRSLKTLTNLRERFERTAKHSPAEDLQGFWNALGIIRPHYFAANEQLAKSRTLQFLRPSGENAEKIKQVQDWNMQHDVEREVRRGLRQSASKNIESLLGPNGEAVTKILQSQGFRNIDLNRRDPGSVGLPWVMQDSMDDEGGESGNYSIRAVASNNRVYNFEFRSRPPNIQIRMSINGNQYGIYRSLEEMQKVVESQMRVSRTLEESLGPNGQRVVALLQTRGFNEITIGNRNPQADRWVVNRDDENLASYFITAKGNENRNYRFDFFTINPSAVEIRMSMNGNQYGSYSSFAMMEQNLQSDISRGITAQRKVQQERQKQEVARKRWWRPW